MNFTDLSFLFGFLPIVLLVYQPFKKTRAANWIILIASLLFYGWGSLQSLFVLACLLIFNWVSALQIEESSEPVYRRFQMIFAVCVNLLVLFFYRYLGVWFSFLDAKTGFNLARLPGLMPMGLSFYIFSCLSCIFDVYRNKAPACRSLVDFGVFAAFFGRVNMGPIANYAQTLPQLREHPSGPKKTAQGFALFFQGLFRKVVLADSLALVFAAMQGNTSWLGNLILGFSYFLQLYFDFSGYSRMARGLGVMFGFDIPKNFDLPYCALSVQEFWRRWHISLTSWFRNYVYIPMGGNRVSQTRWVLNIMTVWLLTGLWHGATWTFLLWGLFQGLLILAEKFLYGDMLARAPKFVSHFYVTLTQLIGWTLFFAFTPQDAFGIIGRYFGIGVTGFADEGALFALRGMIVLLPVCILMASGCTPLLTNIGHHLCGRSWRIWQVCGYLLIFGICTVFLLSATSQTFLYAVF